MSEGWKFEMHRYSALDIDLHSKGNTSLYSKNVIVAVKVNVGCVRMKTSSGFHGFALLKVVGKV